MKKINFFFIHGWGFDSSFWSPVTTSFKKKYSYSISLFDLGFFGKERLNIKVEKGNINIFILHSYGLNWFLKQSYNADFIINFSGSPIFIDPKIENIFLKKKLERMIFMFEKTPKKVLEEFYHRCGLKSFSCNKTESHFNKKKMLCVLNNLLKDDLRDKVNNFECPMLSIYLKGDKILNYRQFDNYFFDKKHKDFLILNKQYHAFPFLYPDDSVKIIENYLKIFLSDFE